MDRLLDLAHSAATNIGYFGITFLLVLSVLVFVHEWGHYIVARLCGIRVETFSIGFGKEIWGFHDKNGTRWKISMIPLGGYVKMFGDTDPASAGHVDGAQLTEKEKSVAFFAKPVSKRAAVVFAGPAINFIFAMIILAILYCTVGKPITPPQAMGVEVGGAADIAGFEPHDIVKSINGREIKSFDSIRREVMLALDTPMQFVVDRGGKEINLTATPNVVEEKDRFGFTHELGFLGLIGPANGLDVKSIKAVNGKSMDMKNPEKTRAVLVSNLDNSLVLEMEGGKPDSKIRVKPPADMNKNISNRESPEFNGLVLGVRPGDEIRKMNPLTASVEAVVDTGAIISDTLKALGQMVTGTRSAKELGGIIRIGAMAGDMAQRGFIALVTFTALLSINLGLINLFPIPMLDGGHLVFYGLEAIKGKPLSEKVQEYAFRFGMVLLVCLMVFANLNDIIQLIL